MSVLFYPESIRILGSDANGNNIILCEMAVDDIANLPAANAFISDGYVLSMGCVATAINDNSKHRLNGSGNWIQIAAGTSTYTRAEIDAILSAIDEENTSQQAEINYAINTGAKNLVWYDREVGSQYTTQGRTFTILTDGGIEITGNNVTQTNADFYLNGLWTTTNVIFDLSDKDYYISLSDNIGSVVGGIMFRALNRSTGSTVASYSATLAARQRILKDKITTIFITVTPDVTLPPDGIIIYPMIRPAAITDPTYVPYAPTNRQLYEMILQLQGG